MKFTQTHTDFNGNVIETVNMEIHQDAFIDDVLEAFSRFLKAVGYHFDGNIEIVSDMALDDFNIDLSEYDDETVDLSDIENPANLDWPFPTSTKP